MQKLILKKIDYLGNSFYKIIDIVDNIKEDMEIDDFSNILNSDKELFFYEIDDNDHFDEFTAATSSAASLKSSL